MPSARDSADGFPAALRVQRPHSQAVAMDRTTTPRILFVVGQLSMGGAERQLLYLLQAMERERYRPAVVVWNYRENEPCTPQIDALDVPIYPLPAAASSASKLLSLRRLIGRLRPEVVHSYSFFTNVGVYLGALGTGAIAIGSIRGDYLEDVKSTGPVRGSVNSWWPRFQIFNSASALKNAHTASGPFRPRRGAVVYNALDLDRFPRRTEGERASAPSAIIMGVGSLLALKRWDRLLTAAAELKRQGFAFEVEIAGDGPMRPSLEARALALGVSDRVRFLGHVGRIEDRLLAASMLAHTSDSEGCPNAVMEAMASGLPVVATSSGDVPRLVEHGVTGFVVSREDDVSLAECLGALIKNGPLRRQMGLAGRLKAERDFGLPRLVSETLGVYRNAGWQDSRH